MKVIVVNANILPVLCGQSDHAALNGCALLYRGAGEGRRGTCVIYVNELWKPGTESYNLVLNHEARHCRGWRHVGDQ